MTHILDLPNELLLTMAEAMDCDTRRRFSKVCRQLFYLIRAERKHPFDLRRKAEAISVHHSEIGGCVIRIGHHEEKIGDDCVLVVRSSELQVLPRKLRSVVEQSTVDEDKIQWITCVAYMDKTMEMLSEALKYYSVEITSYKAHYKDFNWDFAGKVLKPEAIKVFRTGFGDGTIMVHINTPQQTRDQLLGTPLQAEGEWY